MALTSAQLTILAADINAQAALATNRANKDASLIAVYYNTVSSPDYWVYKSIVSVNELMSGGFDWTRVDNLTVGKSRIWEWMTSTSTVAPSEPAVRAGWLAVFATAGDPACRQAIAAHAQRLATRGEKLYATGSGTTITEQFTGPATMGFEGQMRDFDVQQAMGW